MMVAPGIYIEIGSDGNHLNDFDYALCNQERQHSATAVTDENWHLPRALGYESAYNLRHALNHRC